MTEETKRKREEKFEIRPIPPRWKKSENNKIPVSVLGGQFFSAELVQDNNSAINETRKRGQRHFFVVRWYGRRSSCKIQRRFFPVRTAKDNSITS